MDLPYYDVVLRLAASVVAGGIVGVNRDLHDKPIGTRTLGLVSLGAAVAVVTTLQVPGIAEDKDALSRVVQGMIQGIMAGISFIGAGVILRNADKGTVEGLTTAATVWIAAALGIACGLGRWEVVVTATVMAVMLLIAAPLTDKWLNGKSNDQNSNGTKTGP